MMGRQGFIMRHFILLALAASLLPLPAAAQSKESQESQPHASFDGQKNKYEPPKKDDAVDDPNGRSLIGIVRNANDQAVPFSLVRLKNVRTGRVRTIVAAKDGAYRFDGLSPKIDYQVSAESKGMRSTVRKLSLYDTRPLPYFSLVLSEPVPPPAAEAKK